MRTPNRTRKTQAWDANAEKQLQKILAKCRKIPELAQNVVLEKSDLKWWAGVKEVSSAKIRALNAHYLKKNYVTDILSFPSPHPFRDLGYLGELVVCLPVLKKQAKEHKHSEKEELKVLLVHGVLHLLGMDHEGSRKAATEMARWEAKLLGIKARRSGLIVRAHSGKRNK